MIILINSYLGKISKKKLFLGCPWCWPTPWWLLVCSWPRWSRPSGNSIEWLTWSSWTTLIIITFLKNQFKDLKFLFSKIMWSIYKLMCRKAKFLFSFFWGAISCLLFTRIGTSLAKSFFDHFLMAIFWVKFWLFEQDLFMKKVCCPS